MMKRMFRQRSLARPTLLAAAVALLAVAMALLGWSLTRQQTPRGEARAPTSPGAVGPSGPIQRGTVTRIVDGDTIHVEIDGVRFRVRYIGIDTPERRQPGSPVEWMAREAAAANERLVAGRTVVLERDVSDVDRFGRLLRYVWLEDPDGWLLVNDELVRLGFAHAVTYPPDVRYQERFLAAQREAREAGRGLWGPVPSAT